MNVGTRLSSASNMIVSIITLSVALAIAAKEINGLGVAIKYRGVVDFFAHDVFGGWNVGK